MRSDECECNELMSATRETFHLQFRFRAGLGAVWVLLQPLAVVCLLWRLLVKLLGALVVELDPRLAIAGAAKVVCTNAVEACWLARLGGPKRALGGTAHSLRGVSLAGWGSWAAACRVTCMQPSAGVPHRRCRQ